MSFAQGNKYIILFIICILSFASLFLAGPLDAGIVGSKHDFSVGGGSMFAFDSFQVCIFCHTPHGANMVLLHNGTTGETMNGRLLWNRSTPGQEFNVYRSDTLNFAGTSTTPQPGSVSLLCLSCHDGIGAMNVLVNPGTLTNYLTGTSINQFGDASTDPIINMRNIGGASGTGAGLDSSEGTGGDSLVDDHPVGFVYDSALASSDGNLKVPINTDFVDAAQKVRLFEGRVECSSCHNPHDNSLGSFLVMDNAGSTLCQQCHTK